MNFTKIINFVNTGVKLLPLLYLAPSILQAAPVDNEPVSFTADSYSMIIFPDIQGAVADVNAGNPGQLEKFTEQIRWILDNKISRNIIFVLTLGDNTNNNSDQEWERFDGENTRGTHKNLGMKDIINNNIPIGIVMGNHDYSPYPDTIILNKGSSRFEEYFDDIQLKVGTSEWDYYDDPLDSGSRANTYSTFTAPDGKNFLFLNIEFGPRDTVLDWANEVVGSHSSHYVIMSTHAYVYPNAFKDFKGLRYTGYDASFQNVAPHTYSFIGPSSWKSPPTPYPAYPFNVVNDLGYPTDYEGNDGREIWEKLVSQHSNFGMVTSGHVDAGDSFGRIESYGVNGNVVHEMLSNYQVCDETYCGPDGHSSYLRILEFQPGGETVHVKTYSPNKGKWLNDSRNNFSIQLTQQSSSIAGKRVHIPVNGIPVFLRTK